MTTSIDIKGKLTHAVTRYDRQQEEKAARSKRAYHNVYALAQYLSRVDDIMDDIAEGAAVDAAICAGFTPGLLRTAALKACGFTTSKVETHGSYKGMPVYQPVSERG